MTLCLLCLLVSALAHPASAQAGYPDEGVSRPSTGIGIIALMVCVVPCIAWILGRSDDARRPATDDATAVATAVPVRPLGYLAATRSMGRAEESRGSEGAGAGCIMDEVFTVGLAPDAAARFVRTPRNWERLIPGVINDPAGKLEDEHDDGWTLSGGGLRYTFADAALALSDASQPAPTQASLQYNVRVTGSTLGCVPIDFSIHVEYVFDHTRGGAEAAGEHGVATSVKRSVHLVALHRLACCLEPVVKSSTLSACRTENKNMQRAMKSVSRS